MSVKNTADLRTLLIETIEGVKDGSIEPRKATAIGALTGKILQSAKLDLDVLRLTKRTEEIGSKQFAITLVGGK